MAKIKYDVREVEPRKDFDEPIPVGVYKMVVASALVKKAKSSGNEMIELELEVPAGEHKGRKVWEYIVLDESSEWKLRQLIDALGAKLKGTLDTDKMIGETIVVKAKHESYETTNDEGEEEVKIMAKVAALLKPKSEDEEEEDEEEEAEEEESEDEEAEDESEEEEDEEEDEEAEDDEEDEGDLTQKDLEGYDRKTLKAFIKENESAVKVTKGKSDDDIRRAIAEEFEVEWEDEEEADEEEEDAESWADKTMAELKKELKRRDLKATGTKKALVKRLEKDDAKGAGKKGDEPF
jgi:hypothetical protein